MAIRMGSARRGRDVVLAAEVQSAPSGSRDSYICHHCSARVVFVRQQVRQYASGPVSVGAFFRLYSSANPHEPACIYLVQNRLKRLADEVGDAVLVKKGVIYEYHIDVLSQTRHGPATAASSTPGASPASPARLIAGRPSSPWELVRQSCKTALDLFQLHVAMTSEQPLDGHIRILAGGRRLEWNEFFFDHRQAGDFARLLRILMAQPDQRYAACVTGTIMGFSEETGKTCGPYLLVQTRPIAEVGQQPLRVKICSTQPFLRTMATVDNLGKTFAACGVLKLQNPSGDPRHPNRIAYLWINDPREIAMLDTSL